MARERKNSADECTCYTFAVHKNCPLHGWMFEERQDNLVESVSKNPLQLTPTGQSK